MEIEKLKDRESGWKRVVCKKEHGETKQGKTNRNVELDNKDHSDNKSVKEKIRKHGELALDAETGFQMKIQ
eukprot:12748169-Ditylum_brightwellii.AAC.1